MGQMNREAPGALINDLRTRMRDGDAEFNALKFHEKVSKLEDVVYHGRDPQAVQRIAHAAVDAHIVDLAKHAELQQDELERLREQLAAQRSAAAHDEAKRKQKRKLLEQRLAEAEKRRDILKAELYHPLDRLSAPPKDPSQLRGDNPMIQVSQRLLEKVDSAERDGDAVVRASAATQEAQKALRERLEESRRLRDHLSDAESKVTTSTTADKVHSLRDRLVERKEEQEDKELLVDPTVYFQSADGFASGGKEHIDTADEFVISEAADRHYRRLGDTRQGVILTPRLPPNPSVDPNTGRRNESASITSTPQPASSKSAPSVLHRLQQQSAFATPASSRSGSLRNPSASPAASPADYVPTLSELLRRKPEVHALLARAKEGLFVPQEENRRDRASAPPPSHIEPSGYVSSPTREESERYQSRVSPPRSTYTGGGPIRSPRIEESCHCRERTRKEISRLRLETAESIAAMKQSRRFVDST